MPPDICEPTRRHAWRAVLLGGTTIGVGNGDETRGRRTLSMVLTDSSEVARWEPQPIAAGSTSSNGAMPPSRKGAKLEGWGRGATNQRVVRIRRTLRTARGGDDGPCATAGLRRPRHRRRRAGRRARGRPDGAADRLGRDGAGVLRLGLDRRLGPGRLWNPATRAPRRPRSRTDRPPVARRRAGQPRRGRRGAVRRRTRLG